MTAEQAEMNAGLLAAGEELCGKCGHQRKTHSASGCFLNRCHCEQFQPAAAAGNSTRLSVAVIDFTRAWMQRHYPEMKEKDPDAYYARLGMLYDFVTDVMEKLR